VVQFSHAESKLNITGKSHHIVNHRQTRKIAMKKAVSALDDNGFGSEEREAFILGAPILDPGKLEDDAFEAVLLSWFYKVVRLNTEHLYSETSDSILKKNLCEQH